MNFSICKETRFLIFLHIAFLLTFTTSSVILENLLFTAKVVENREKFEYIFGNNKRVKQFIKELVGLERQVVTEAFSRYRNS
ncbi:MAG TPA: hypothetical protein V6C58_02145 [Allocoleopsis sp.]